ncbi:MAG: MFS transporter [Chloroflexi bacterium]|nr:MFS transporter [Chloroflexota bacterium]
MNAAHESDALEAEVQRHYHRNFLANFGDLSFFWFGNTFISSATILSLYVARASESAVLVGLVAAIGSAFWYLPQIVAANYTERYPRRKPIVIKIGFFAERLPIWLIALSAFLMDPTRPGPALALFFFAYSWHSLGAGTLGPAWQDLLARTIPTERRGSFFGLSNFTGSALGAGGATVAGLLLARFPFPQGFAWCFLIAAGTILVSWVCLAQVREPNYTTAKEPVSLGVYLRRLPAALRSDRNFSFFILNRAANGVGRMATGFFTVYAVTRWGLPDSAAGAFTVLLLLSQALSYLLLGFVADRWGHKVVLEFGTLLAVLALATCLAAPSVVVFYLVFVAWGINTAADTLSGLMITLEFTGPENRPTYVGLANTTTGIFSAVSPLVGGVLASVMGYRVVFVIAGVMMVMALGVLHWLVQEPRRAAAEARAATSSV